MRVYKDQYIEAMDKLEQESGKYIGGTDGNEETGDDYRDFDAIDLSEAGIEIEDASDKRPERKQDVRREIETDKDIEEALESGSAINRADLEEEVGQVVNCPMCGKMVTLNQQILQHRPLKLTCRECGNQWMIR